MKIGNKSLILIAMLLIVGFIICIGFFFLLAATNTPTTVTEIPDDSEQNVNQDNQNVIDINKKIGSSSVFVGITNENTIQSIDFSDANLKNLVLQKYNWKDLKVSENGKYFSVLGRESIDNAYNLFIYSFDKGSIEKKTTFTVTSGGISTYVWQSNVVFFMQGKGVENWLHRFNPASDEIFKVKQIEGLLVQSSKDNKFIFLKDNKYRPKVIDNNGEEVWDLTNIKDVEDRVIAVDEVMFTDVFDKVVIKSGDRLYKAKFKEDLAAEIEVDAKYNKWNFACSAVEDSLLGVVNRLVDNKFIFVSLDVVQQQVREIKEIEGLSFEDTLDVKCEGANLLLTIKDNGYKFIYNDGQNISIDQFKDAKEIIVKF